jgi:predicted dienelactone hydrolase
MSADPGTLLSGAIDSERIGLSGLSLGGLTTTLAAFHATLRDPRVDAAVNIAGPGCFFAPAFYDAVSVPLLTIHGDIDAIVPYVENARFQFEGANPPKRLATIRNASHTAFNEVGARLMAPNPDDIGCIAIGGPRPPGRDRTLLDALGGAEAGVIEGDCPGACSDPTPRPAALSGPRQLDLTILTVFPFFEAVLRGDRAAERFHDVTVSEENPEVTVEAVP